MRTHICAFSQLSLAYCQRQGQLYESLLVWEQHKTQLLLRRNEYCPDVSVVWYGAWK